MPTVLFAWIGLADLKAASETGASEGPIAHAVTARAFDHVVLLSDHPKKDGDRYVGWLAERAASEIVLRPASLKSPTAYEDIYVRVRDNVAWARKQYGPEAKFGNGFDLRALLDQISSKYIERALAASPHNKTEAAKLIGFGSQQLLSQWMKRLDVEVPK